MSGGRKVVCVTGASGFIASWLVKALLQRGYIVKATVRDPNLLEEGSFDPVIDGCEGVFHTASPVLFTSTDPQAELIDPAVKGTLNVLRSCVKFSTVKRVVFTSSMASVMVNGKPLTPGVVIDETWFSDPLLCENLKEWYFLSKILAEEAAWNFAKGNGIDLVTINPSYVIGPLLQPTLNLTVEMLLNLKNDIQDVTGSSYLSTDVRDVASAHIQAFEVPSASGRYCLVAHVMPMSKALKIMHELHPSLCPPEKHEDGNPPEPTYQVSKEKAKSLVRNFLPFEVSLRDTVESLKENGFLKV